MSKQRKKKPPQSIRVETTPTASSLFWLTSLLQGTQLFLAGTLILARYFVPAESAPDGDTLTFALGWFLVTILYAASFVTDRSRSFRLDLFDCAVWLLVAGQVLSTLVMIGFGEGQQRAALNMMWEWVALGCSFSLIRRLIATSALRGTLIVGFITTVVVLSVYGIWQHHWMYDQLSKEYLATRQQYDATRSPEAQQKLLSMGVPAHALHGSGRELFERRLLDSSEPLGMFALANTFAGLLTVGFLLSFAVTIDCFFRKSVFSSSLWNQWKPGVFLLSTMVIGYCLILTKSRTAWVGLIGGLVSLGLLKLLQSRQSTTADPQRWKKQLVKWGGLATILCIGFLLLATLSGGFDRAVLTEAPKSLQYRIEYWTATWDVIKENPIWGTGPGNFRSHYLKFKLPGSSEEIADPHNFILDVWANAGLIAFAGLLLILCLACYRWLIKPLPDLNAAEQQAPLTGNLFSQSQLALLSGFGLSFALLWGVQLFLFSVDESILWLFCLGWLVLFFILNNSANLSVADPDSNASILPLAFGAAFISLCIHLSGAGGIAMPAITQTWLLLLALAFPVVTRQATPDAGSVDQAKPNSSQTEAPIHLRAIPLSACLILTFFFIWSSFAPTIQRKSLVLQAEQSLMRGSSVRNAQRYFSQASQVDSISPGPWQALAEIEFQEGEQNRSAFERGVELKEAAIQRDPMNPLHYFDLGRQWEQQYQASHQQDDLTAALESFQRAVAGYPNNSLYRAEFANALSEAGKSAESQHEARRAIELDDANRRGQHVDKYLNEDMVSRMKEIINATPSNQN
ncbi:O-antigen ligase family protein [Gimesia maris]|uniref:O-antigen ligase family protein n=1 Tax=Gimesia maris TaxID=122 RepID=UPI00241E8554|nr:O-antigen ligase family protein [Gimesia maris]|tara:strand:- start:213601 stop:215997 length:2397 start_codon:yes stop_codon:yes gene_type:complete